jgi:hypothetical protein
MESSHQSLNPNAKAKIEYFELLKSGLDGTLQDLWKFIEVNFGHDPKTWFDPYVLFSHHKNIGGQEAIVSKVEKQLNVIRFSRLRTFSGTT